MRYYSNTANATALSGSVSSSAVTIQVDDVTGFPLQYPYTLSIDADNASKEIVEVTAASGTSLTVTRGVDGTSGMSHALGAVVSHDHSARDFREPQQHIDATANVHGVTSDVVGVSDTQSLTNKTLVTPTLQSPAFTGSPTGLTKAHIGLASVDNTDDMSKPVSNDTASAIMLAQGTVQGNLNQEIGDRISGDIAATVAAAPIGTVSMYAGAAAPSKWLLCNGATVSRATYSDLFSIIGTTYGAGDGTSTFALPDLRGRFPREGTPGTTGGQDSVTLVEANLPAHTHQIDSRRRTESGSTGASFAIVGVGTGGGGTGDTVTGSTSSVGSGTAFDNRPAFFELNFIIRAEV